MTTEPRRPTTRASQPGKPPTGRVPQHGPPPKPATGRIPPPPSRKPTTRVGPAAPSGRTSRSIPVQAKSGSMPLIVGAAVAGVGLLVLVVVLASGPNKKRPEASNARPAAEPTDVSGLESAGMEKCERGLHLFQQCDSMMRSANLSTSDKARLKGDLNQVLTLITDGNRMLDRANQMTNYRNKYDTTKYNQALKLARGKLLELK